VIGEGAVRSGWEGRDITGQSRGAGAAQGPIMRRLGLAQAVTLVSLSSCESGKGDRDPPGKKTRGKAMVRMGSCGAEPLAARAVITRGVQLSQAQAGRVNPHLCVETDITLWFFSGLDCSESRLVLVDVILQGTYYPLHMTRADDHT